MRLDTTTTRGATGGGNPLLAALLLLVAMGLGTGLLMAAGAIGPEPSPFPTSAADIAASAVETPPRTAAVIATPARAVRTAALSTSMPLTAPPASTPQPTGGLTPNPRATAVPAVKASAKPRTARKKKVPPAKPRKPRRQAPDSVVLITPR
jgi:hypothetical protein